MQVYLNKTKILALLMMINEAEEMISGSADGWHGLNKTNPDFYEKIQDAICDLRENLKENGYDFEKDVSPIIR